MVNYYLSHIPERPSKPRSSGITMVMDKGMGVNEAANFIDASCHLVDFVKLGFGTSFISNRLEEKIKLYRSAGIRPYFGGTLFEAFIVRDMFDDFQRLLDKYSMDTVEVSDGSVCMESDVKCNYIRKLASSRFVLSEVGSKDCNVIYSPEEWIKMLKDELAAGSSKVITEARESGNVGIYNQNGSADTLLINKIASAVDSKVIIWEAPNKSQQAWFVNLLGPNVNLGNIAPEEVIPLETLRLGLRGDTFMNFLPEEIKSKAIL